MAVKIKKLVVLGSTGSIGQQTLDIVRAMPERFSIFGLAAAAGVTVFALRPVAISGGVALYVLGFLAFAQAVWNTSRVPHLAEPVYQARLQAVTSMAFTLGTPLGALWGGAAVDRFGPSILVAGAGILAVISLAVLVGCRRK